MQNVECANAYQGNGQLIRHPRFLFVYEGLSKEVYGANGVEEPETLFGWLSHINDGVSLGEAKDFLKKNNPKLTIIVNESGEEVSLFSQDSYDEQIKKIVEISKKNHSYMDSEYRRKKLESKFNGKKIRKNRDGVAYGPVQNVEVSQYGSYTFRFEDGHYLVENRYEDALDYEVAEWSTTHHLNPHGF